MKYLVIGSNCFTGSHIVDALLEKEDSKVIGVSRSAEYNSIFLPYKNRDLSRYSFHQIDMTKEFDKLTQLLDRERPDFVINVAALSEVALSNDIPIEYFHVNTVAVVELCKYLQKNAPYLKRYVHISSAEIFGTCSGLLDEDAPFNPSTPYAVSKAAADQFLYTMMKNFDFPAIIIRSTNVYGKYQQLFKIIPRTFIYLKLNKPIELHGGGKSSKSFIHIRDVVNGLMLTMEKEKMGTFHFSVPNDQTISDIVHRIVKLENREPYSCIKNVGERLGQDAKYLLDCSKAEKELGWSPKVTFQDGVIEIKKWIDQYWDVIKEQPLSYVHKR